MNFLERAQYTAAKGVPVIRLRPYSKAAMDVGWPQLATTDLETLKKWNSETPDANCGAVALGDYFFFEVDSRDVIPRLEAETGQLLPDTFKVRSRQGRGHLYFKSTPAVRAMGNLSQAYVKNQDFSVRVENAYVVSSFSVHPDSGLPYEPLGDSQIVECPDWLVSWFISQKIAKANSSTADAPRNDAGLVPHGAIHGYLLSNAGRLRNMGLGADAIETSLLELAHKNCQPPIDDSKVRAMAKSICNFPPGNSGELILSQAAKPSTPLDEDLDVEPLLFNETDYPQFPRWIMDDTSIYEHFVKPICAVNSRIPEFMWVPATMLMMNFLGNKISIWGKDFRPNLYAVIIGRKGKTNKSSSVQDGMKYFEYAGVLSHAGRDTKMAEGKSLMWSAGSPEGLGSEMQRTNCKNSILFYDELSQLVNKAGIEGSSLSTALLTMYESGKFQNVIKSKKDSFSIEPGSYCATVICCTTDQKFTDLWSRMAGEDSGLNDRFFFLLQPDPLPETKLFTLVDVREGALKTRQLIDKAVKQGVYHFVDQSPFEEIARLHGNRTEIRAEKWALAFAIDLGRDEVDEDCVERAIAITRYEIAVKAYLKTFEARNEEALIQQKVMALLERSKGTLSKREMERKIHPGRYGTSRWEQAYKGLLIYRYIAEEGDGTRSNPRVVRMLRRLESVGDDDE